MIIDVAFGIVLGIAFLVSGFFLFRASFGGVPVALREQNALSAKVAKGQEGYDATVARVAFFAIVLGMAVFAIASAVDL